MPPKKKKKLIAGQMTLTGGFATRDMPSSSSTSLSDSTTTHARSGKGDVDSWRDFADSKWNERHQWLDIASDGVYCRFCRDGNVAGISRSGTKVFRSEPYTGTRPYHLSRHESSAEHTECAKVYRDKIHRAQRHERIEESLARSNQLTTDGEAFCDAVRCLYWLTKQEIPHTTNFASLRELCIILGNATLPRLMLSKNRTYQSEQTMHELILAIGSVFEEETLKQIVASPYYSIVIDEVTDITVHKQLGIVVHYLNMDTGLPVCKYLKLLEITAVHANAEAITTALCEYLNDNAQPAPGFSRLAGTSCDGASVMMGPENGVMARLKQKVPNLVVTHCAAHRLSLAACDTAKDLPWFQRFDKTLCQVYSFFSRSCVHTVQLSEIQKALNQPELHLKRPTETRWLSLEYAIDALRKSLQSVSGVLNQEADDGDATALGLAIALSKPQFLITLWFLSDVISTVASLSRAVQSESLNLLGLEQLVESHISTLSAIRTDPYSGGYMSAAPPEIEEVDRSTFISKAQQYLDKLIMNIRYRFPQCRTLTLFGVLDPRNAPKATVLDVMELASIFDLDASKVWNEFRSYTAFVEQLPDPSLINVVHEMWKPGQTSVREAYPHISHLLARFVVLPASSASVERVFSTLKRIKTPLRNRLKIDTMDSLIQASMNGPSITDFQPIPVALKWKSCGNRRIVITD